MKTILHVLFLLFCVKSLTGQITPQAMKAGFGVDGELRANFYSNVPQSPNDDWFSMSAGSGNFVIDTAGAAEIVSRYATDPAFRKIPFYRTMKVDPYTLLGAYRVIDAVFIRDYHGDDSTVFAAGSNKNGMSPQVWTCPVSQSIPDKNEILDMMVHVRRAGPNSTDSLWMFGGISIENTVGNRYFDFEMYQTDIYYDRASRKFYGYGPDAGHTAWRFDGSGNITTPGDIIFSAEYGSSTLSGIEARIWIDRASLSINPVGFNWSGSFDGASSGSQYGYAGITPKTAGAFYTGLSSINGTWAGPFQLVKGDNSVVNTYTAQQFMEFSVNLSKLGLDPVTLLGSDACGMPFRRILVKSRSAVSFTAELKDFVGPFDFFLAPRADVTADLPYYCGSVGVSTLQVVNPVTTSEYTWATLDGSIAGSSTGTSITVNAPGTYVLTQRLQSGCSVYATDTITIPIDPLCTLLDKYLLGFEASLKATNPVLTWTTVNSGDLKYFDIERSVDGKTFEPVAKVTATAATTPEINYSASDNVAFVSAPAVYYRLKVFFTGDQYKYSRTVQLKLAEKQASSVIISPNPVHENIRMHLFTPVESDVRISVYSADGKRFRTISTHVQKGASTVNIGGLEKWPANIYHVQIVIGTEVYTKKVVLVK